MNGHSFDVVVTYAGRPVRVVCSRCGQSWSVAKPPTWCAICGVRDSVNPVEDHENWLGHPWTPRNVPGRVSLSEAAKLGL